MSLDTLQDVHQNVTLNKPTAKTFQSQDNEEDHQRGGSTKCVKTQGYR